MSVGEIIPTNYKKVSNKSTWNRILCSLFKDLNILWKMAVNIFHEYNGAS